MYVLSILVEATSDDLARGLSSWQTVTSGEASPSVVIGTSTYEAYLAGFVPAVFRDRPHTFLKNVAFDQIAAAVWSLGELNIADAPALHSPTGAHDSVRIIPGEVVELFRRASDETLRKCAKRVASSLAFEAMNVGVSDAYLILEEMKASVCDAFGQPVSLAAFEIIP